MLGFVGRTIKTMDFINWKLMWVCWTQWRIISAGVSSVSPSVVESKKEDAHVNLTLIKSIIRYRNWIEIENSHYSGRKARFVFRINFFGGRLPSSYWLVGAPPIITFFARGEVQLDRCHGASGEERNVGECFAYLTWLYGLFIRTLMNVAYKRIRWLR